MPDLILLTSDPALREAVVEQCALQPGLGAARIVDILPDNPPADAALLLDADALDDKNRKLLPLAAACACTLIMGSLKDHDPAAAHIQEIIPKPLRLGFLFDRLGYHRQRARYLHEPLSFGPYRLEPQNRLVLSKGKTEPIRLTEKETALLAYIGHAGPVGRDSILRDVWGYEAGIDTHTIETHIYQLRRKLDPDETGQQWLINENGAYRLDRHGQ
jgi:hypothetical protein